MHPASLGFRALVTIAALMTAPAGHAQSCHALDPALAGGYTGACKNGLAHGRGTAVGKWGDSYTGMWANGLKHGPGKYTSRNGNSFVGRFVDDEPVTDADRFRTLRAADDPNWRILAAKRDPELTKHLEEARRTGGPVPLEAAVAALRKGDYAQAYGIVKTAAERGSAVATLALGDYWSGLGYEHNEAVRYFEEAGKLGSAEAYRRLASLNEHSNPAMANRYLALASETAAKQGPPPTAAAVQGATARVVQSEVLKPPESAARQAPQGEERTREARSVPPNGAVESRAAEPRTPVPGATAPSPLSSDMQN